MHRRLLAGPEHHPPGPQKTSADYKPVDSKAHNAVVKNAVIRNC